MSNRSAATGKWQAGGSRAWAWLLFTWLCLIFLTGGTSLPASSLFLFQTVSALAMLLAGLWRLRGGIKTSLAGAGLGLAGLAFVLGLAQLMPLPATLWQALPARETIVKAFELTGGVPSSLPLTLSPDGTRGALLAMLVPLAAFVGVLSLRRSHFLAVSGCVFVCGLVGITIGLLQRFLGEASGLYFYSSSGNLAVGTFGNRNFFATQIVLTIPMAAAFLMAARERLRVSPVLLSLFSIVYLAMLVAGLAASGSRSGVILGSIAILLTALFVFRLSASEGKGAKISKLSIVALVLLLVISQVGMVTIMRFVQMDTMDDFRGTVFAVTMEAFWAFFPWGSGFGSFVPVYQMFEKPNDIIEAYVNAAHSDWLQVLLEGGVPAAVLLVLFAVWYLAASGKALNASVRDAAAAHHRAASIGLLLVLLHAVVDFPLRVPGILALFGAYCALLALTDVSRRRPSDWELSHADEARPMQDADQKRPQFRSVGRFGPVDRGPPKDG
jgi:O-antigen ligase